MNIVYPMLLFIFIFAAVTTGVNELGIYQIQMPTSGLNAQQSDISNTNAAMIKASSSSGFSFIDQMFIFGKCLIAGSLALVTIIPLMASFGIPLAIAGMIQLPITFVTLWWLYEVWLGRSVE